MNFLSLKYFITVEKHRSFTKAASELFVTQQTLSAHIAAIEKELNCTLFVRTNPLELTYGGETFLLFAREIYKQYCRLKDSFNDDSDNWRGNLKIGIAHTRGRAIMPGIIHEFHTFFPHMEIQLVEDLNANLIKRFQKGDLDLIVAQISETPRGMTSEFFYKEQLVMLIPMSFFGKYSIPPECGIYDVKECPFLLSNANDITGNWADSHFQKKGIVPNVVARSENIETIIDMCVNGYGVCFTPKSFFDKLLTKSQKNKVKVIYIDDATPLPISFGYDDTNEKIKVIREFINICKSVQLASEG